LFEFLNTSKRAITLDLSTVEGERHLAELASSADVIIETADPRSLLTPGLTLEMLQARNPELAVVSISPFGLTGPRAGVAATEFTLQAYCGSIVRGPDDEAPLQAGGRLGEWAAGAFAAIAVLAARRHAHRNGRGQHIDLSTLECMTLTFNPYPSVLRSFLRTDDPGPRKREIPSIVAAKDGWVGFCTVTAQQWESFLLLIERADLLDDAELRTWDQRVRRYDEVLATIESWTTSRTVDEILEQAEMFRVPAAPVGDGATIPSIQHLQARAVYGDHPGGRFIQPRSPLLLQASPPRPFEQAPALGAPAPALESVPLWPPRAESTASPDPAAGAPLAGLRIVDLTAFWAGPMAAQCLGALGADVVKVESVQRPDPMRFSSVSTPEDPTWYERSPIFHGANVGKRSITLDLSRPVGRELLLRLIAGADALVENFSPRVMEQFGLDYDQLSAANPRLIMVRMPAFGLTGPWRDRVGFAQTMEQISGMASVTGHPDAPPLVPSGPCDVLAGTHAVVALLAALAQRDRTGTGQLVEVPMVEVALNVAAEVVIAWSSDGSVVGRHGNRDPVAAPQGLYRCRDGGWLALTVATDAQWDRLSKLLGSPSWSEASDLRTAPGRRAAHDDIDVHLRAYVRAYPLDALVSALHDAGIPAAPVVGAGLVDRDEQMRSRGFFESVAHPVMGAHEVPGWPMRPAAEPTRWYPRPAPMLGEHNVEVLRELGVSEPELAELEREHVIGTTPVGL
jgi:crotonobetainyl-CoA:carnitine CoA-transferase CaiB-like acyl-CoA transferase